MNGGLSQLTDTLRDSLVQRGVEVRIDEAVQSMTFDNGQAVIDGSLRSDHTFAAVPAKAASKLLEGHHSKLSHLLGSIPYVDVGVVNVEYEGIIDLPCGPAFGLLVPSNQTDIKVRST